MRELALRNAQRAHRVRIDLAREITRHLLEEMLGLANYELAVTLVSPARMAEINQEFLEHEGSTDVISFDYLEGQEEGRQARVYGEIFISVADARKQAREFRTTWQEELVRYIVHGVLHLLGYDDLSPAKRKTMKREEGKLVRRLGKEFPLRKLAG